MVILGDDYAAGELRQAGDRGVGHLPCGLARGDEEDAAGETAAVKRAAHGLIRQHGLDGRGDNRIGMGTKKSGIHGNAPFRN